MTRRALAPPVKLVEIPRRHSKKFVVRVHLIYRPLIVCLAIAIQQHEKTDEGAVDIGNVLHLDANICPTKHLTGKAFPQGRQVLPDAATERTSVSATLATSCAGFPRMRSSL